MNHSYRFPFTFSLLATLEDIIHTKNILVYPLRVTEGEEKRKYSWFPLVLMVVTYMIWKTYKVRFRVVFSFSRETQKK